MYLIFNEALKYDTVNEIISMTSYDTVYTDKNGNEKTAFRQNTNQYLAGNVAAPDRVTVIGGKTGTTSAAGNCLILLARDTSGNPYIAVILKSAERGILYTEMNAPAKNRRLLNRMAWDVSDLTPFIRKGCERTVTEVKIKVVFLGAKSTIIKSYPICYMCNVYI